MSASQTRLTVVVVAFALALGAGGLLVCSSRSKPSHPAAVEQATASYGPQDTSPRDPAGLRHDEMPREHLERKATQPAASPEPVGHDQRMNPAPPASTEGRVAALWQQTLARRAENECWIPLSQSPPYPPAQLNLRVHFDAEGRVTELRPEVRQRRGAVIGGTREIDRAITSLYECVGPIARELVYATGSSTRVTLRAGRAMQPRP